MKTATVRDFKMNASRYFGGNDDVVVTRRGRPVALVTPVPTGSIQSILLEMRSILKSAGITRQEALAALEDVRKEIYGPRRS